MHATLCSRLEAVKERLAITETDFKGTLFSRQYLGVNWVVAALETPLEAWSNGVRLRPASCSGVPCCAALPSATPQLQHVKGGVLRCPDLCSSRYSSLARQEHSPRWELCPVFLPGPGALQTAVALFQTAQWQ